MRRVRGHDVRERLECLKQVAAVGPGRLSEEVVAEAQALIVKGRDRLAAGDHLVVAALLGGTGSGKSSIFNALLGRTLAPVGAARPVTADSRAAAIGEAEAADRLLDWLAVDHRHHLAPGPGLPQGLVLIDLPDHDSVALDHALVSDRFAERVDLLLWVVDPLKYAHEALYDRYLRHLSSLAGVTVVVLNRADEVGDADRRTLAADLRERLDGEGLAGAETVVTAATSGLGMEDLRRRIIHETEQRRAAAERISGDLRALAARAAAELPTPPRFHELPFDRVTAAAAAALEVGAAADEAAAAYREVARAGSHSPAGAALAALAGPLRRAVGAVALWRPARRRPQDRPRRAVPDDGQQKPARVRRALLDLGDAVGAGSPPKSARTLRAVVAAGAGPLIGDAVRAVRALTAPPRRRAWWRLLAVLPALAEAVALVGGVWLVAVQVDLLLIPDPREVATAIGELPAPTVVLLAGLAARVLAGLLRGAVIGVAAGRYRTSTARSLGRAIDQAVSDHVRAPLEAELDALAGLDEAIACVSGAGQTARRTRRA